MDGLPIETTKTLSSVLVLEILLTWESFVPFFFYFAGAPAARGIHALRNLSLGVINAALNGLVCLTMWLQVSQWACDLQFGLLNWVTMPGWARLVGALLLLDAWAYIWHRLNHRIPFLWRFHRVHHSDQRMDVTTASRFHFGEIILSCLLRLPVIALAGVEIWELAFYEALAFFVIQLHHANVSLPGKVDRYARIIVVTPFMHKVHHSCWQPETDSNFSVMFSFWDRLFHTFRLRNDPHSLRLGLEQFDEPRHQTLAGLLTTPAEQTTSPSYPKEGIQSLRV